MRNSLVEFVMQINGDDSTQMARILVLLQVFAGKNNNGTIDGINKLAIFDFLLKYPYAFNKFVEHTSISKDKHIILESELASYEVDSIYACAMKYNFAPWDFQYRRVISVLEAKELITITFDSKKVRLAITQEGIRFTNTLYELEQYRLVREKARTFKKVFGTWSHRRMVEEIYKVFPEILRIKTGLGLEVV